jgi:hypothetical protein
LRPCYGGFATDASNIGGMAHNTLVALVPAQSNSAAKRTLAGVVRRVQRRRRARLLTRNARWVIEARDTPTVWTDFTGERLSMDMDHDGGRSGRRAYDD